MEWTKEQKQAIETEGNDILVAAGAGSGKTAVLVNRIVGMVLDRPEPRDIDSLLVVTFTRAAADEMRSRLFKLLDKRLAQAEDPQMIARIYDQQVRLRRSWITTIDSFCKRILTENMNESGIDASYSVCDDALRGELLSDAVSDAAEKCSLEDPEKYRSLLDAYGSFSSDEKLLFLVEKALTLSLSFPDPDEWLEMCLSSFRDPFPEGDFARTGYGKWLIDIVRLRLKAHLEELIKLRSISEDNEIENCAETLEEDVAILQALVEKIDTDGITWNDAFSACAGVSFPRKKTAKKAVKESWDEQTVALETSISDRRRDVNSGLRDNIIKKLFSGAADTPEIDRKAAGENIETFIGLVRTASESFRLAKAERHLYDYSDMEHMCLNILSRPGETGREPSELARLYRTKFSEIYVDEYQDTSIIQEQILKMISGEKGEGPDLFMVGDMKQSIYAFTNARPELFMDKYSSFSDPEDAASGNGSAKGVRIRLNANFRSSERIIGSVNLVFSRLMNLTTCGMPYGVNEYLNFGGTNDAGQGEAGKTEIVVIDPGDAKVVKADKTELEAYEILCRIKEMIARGDNVSDPSTGVRRPVKYSDICILMRSLSPNGGKLAQLLREGGVPVKDTKDKSGIFIHPEVRTVISFMRIIDNPFCDIPLVTVLKNIYGFSGDIFVRIKLSSPENDIPFYRRMLEFASATGSGSDGRTDEDAEAEARRLTADFISRLDMLRSRKNTRPVSETIWECMMENGFLDTIRALPDGGAAYSNLMRLVSLTTGFERSGGGSFVDYVQMLDTIEQKGSISAATPPETDAVTISSIHGSKGLEYPVVFLAEAGRSRNATDENARMIMHRELGLGPSCFDAGSRTVYPSIMKEAVRLRIARDSRAEEMRLLYVAMTRAKEKLIITGIGGSYGGFVDSCVNKLDRSHKKPMDYYILETDDYLTLLGMAAACADKAEQDSFVLEPGVHAEKYLLELMRDAAAQNVPEAFPEMNGSVSNVRFGLPPQKLWDPSTMLPEEVERAKICPAKISVSEIKRLSELYAGPYLGSGDEGEENTVRLYGDDVFRSLEEPDGPEHSGPENGRRSTRHSDQGGARAGTLLHCCLEHIDFYRIRRAGGDPEEAKKYAEELIDELVSRGFFTASDGTSISRKILAGFICSEFALKMSGYDEIMREIPFAAEYPSDILLGDPGFEGNTTVVQGIIDCVCRRGDNIVLIDYKSDVVPPGEGDGTGGQERAFYEHSKRYLIQLSVYADVIRRAYGKAPDRILLYYLRYGKEYEISGEMIKRWTK